MKNPWSMAEPISRPRAGYVDFSIVPERHQEMHARLENWGRSCNGGQSSDMSPMFRQFVAAEPILRAGVKVTVWQPRPDPRESRQPETFFSRGGRLPLSAWAQAVTGSRG